MELKDNWLDKGKSENKPPKITKEEYNKFSKMGSQDHNCDVEYRKGPNK